MQTGAARAPIQIRTLILNLLSQRSFHPAELLEKLDSSQVSEDRLKDEIAALMKENLVVLSPDRQIKLRPHTKTVTR
jgi:hypothetical protein